MTEQKIAAEIITKMNRLEQEKLLIAGIILETKRASPALSINVLAHVMAAKIMDSLSRHGWQLHEPQIKRGARK